jgi:iron complex outermembrane receptor protein
LRIFRDSSVVCASLCALTWACARAEGESADPAQVEEVVVTAQRRQQNLQDVPVSVTAAGAAALAAAHVDDVSNIKALSPSVSFTTNYNPAVTSNIQVRGVGTVGASRSFEGAVGVFVDGVYRARAGQALENFLDVDSLQILSGPQGTLFGKNTSAGAVLMTSASPNITSVRGTYEASYGNYNTGLVKGAVNLPISDKAAFRIASLWSSREGDFTNPNTDQHYNDHHAKALKAQLLFQSTDNFDLRIIADWDHERQNCCFASIDAVRGPTYALVSALALALGIRSASTNPRDREQALNLNGETRIDDRGGVLQANWRPSLGGELHSITSYRDWDVRQLHFDADFGPADLLNLDENFRTRDFSQELTFNGGVDKTPLLHPADYVVGIYYAHQKISASRNLRWASQAQTYWDTLLSFSGVPVGTVFAAPGLWAQDEMSGHSESLAAFTHWTVSLTERFELIAGARFSREKKDGSFFNPFYRPQPNDVFKVLGVQPGPTYDASHTDDAVSGVLGLQYRFTPGAMGYATYSRGFKAGGVNIDPNAAGAVANNPAIKPGAKPLDPTYRPEFIDGYEAGLKLDYLDRRARTNLAVFYDRIHELQVAAFLGLQFAVFNAPSAKLYGAEIENTFRLTKELTFEAAATYIPEASYGDSALLAAPLSGRRFTNAPTVAANGALSWDHPLTGDLSLTGRVAYQYQTKIFTNSASDATQGAYGLLNLNIGLKSNRNRWTAEFWCLNCTDKTYYIFHYQKTLQAGSEGAYLGPPLTFGMRLIGHF